MVTIELNSISQAQKFQALLVLGIYMAERGSKLAA
jgi:hypothetical protein